MRTILIICPHPEGCAPGQRLKYEQYFDSWRSSGYHIDVRPFWNEWTWKVLYAEGHRARKAAGVIWGYLRRLRDVRDARKADLLYLFLEAAPLGPPVFERIIRWFGKPTIYDIDDLVYLPHQSSANRFMRWCRSPSKVPELMHHADHVIVCTPHLEAFAQQFNDRVTDISSTIDTEAYVPRPHRDGSSDVVIGWSGSHSTSPYLHLLDDVLRELQRTDDVRVRVIGDPTFSIDGVEVEALPWRRETEVADLSEIDIGVYPLPDEEWVLGKSGLKCLQYMALEIPPVAQRIGTNLTIVDHEENGLLVSTEDEWLAALRRLVHDADLRRELGVAARQRVIDRYSISANTPVYLAILDEVRRAGRR